LPPDFVSHLIPHLEKISENVTRVVLVRSPFFDEHINDARNGVSSRENAIQSLMTKYLRFSCLVENEVHENFCEEGEESALFGITAAQFRQGLATALSKPLAPHINKSVQELKSKVEEVVRQDAPSYKPLLAGYFESKDFSGLAKSARAEEILTSIDGYRRREAVQLKKESKRLARIAAKDASYWEAAGTLASQVDVQKPVALAEYVSLRKIVLEHLEDPRNIQENGKASLEKEVHNLIFPQKVDTAFDPGTARQLWIVDERLFWRHQRREPLNIPHSGDQFLALRVLTDAAEAAVLDDSLASPDSPLPLESLNSKTCCRQVKFSSRVGDPGNRQAGGLPHGLRRLRRSLVSNSCSKQLPL
jgi:hypothetical protein